MEEYCPYVEQCDVNIEFGEHSFRYHDCRENVMRNLLNNILYVPSEDRFDLSALHSIQKFAKERHGSHLIDKIISFYEQYNTPKKQGIIIDETKECTVEIDEVQLVKAGTEWASVLSQLKGVTYWWPTGRYRRNFTLGDTHEINAGIGNYLRVFAHMFGLIPFNPPEDYECPIFTFGHLEDVFKSCGVHVQFQPDRKVPIPERVVSKPAHIKDTKYDNHDVIVKVILKEKLTFEWDFIIGHLEVYHTGGPYDHPHDSPSNKYNYIVPEFLPPNSKEVVEKTMKEALEDFNVIFNYFDDE